MIAIVAVGLLLVALLFGCATVLALVTRDLWRALTQQSERARQRRLTAAARLSAEQAVALAAAAIDDPFLRDVLFATPKVEGGALVWHVASATIDMGVTALVDDATGAVRDVHPWSAWPRR